MLQVALIAGVICAFIVVAYFVAIDQVRRAAPATNGNFAAQAPRPTVVKQLEASGYAGWYVLEQDTTIDEGEAGVANPATDVRTSIDYLLGAATRGETP